jgi:peroxiredoxin Q/BCP
MQNHKKKRIKNWTIGLLLIGVIAFVGWWGTTKVNNQKAGIAIKSSTGVLAADFTLPATTGGMITLSDFRGKKNVLLYFHEGLSCQPCWEQIPELEKLLPEFDAMNVVLLSVALDSVNQWKGIIDQYKIKSPILSYANAKTEVDYNLLPFSMAMGRRAGHTFVLVGTDGTIKWRKDYWPGYGMMVAGGTMFVESRYIVQAVKEHLNSQ